MPKVRHWPVLAEETLPVSASLHRWVTFLNQSLKKQGFTFGLAEEGGSYRLTVYRTEPWPEAKPDLTKGAST